MTSKQHTTVIVGVRHLAKLMAELDEAYAEVAQLRSDLAYAQAERDDWKHGAQHEAEEADQLRAQVQAMKAVVEAVRTFDDAVAEFGTDPLYVGDSYQPLHDALAALDQTQRA